MKKVSCFPMGKLLKPHGIKGELSVKFNPGWLNGKQFEKQKFLFAEIYPHDDLVPFFIEYAETDSNGNGRIKLEDYNTIESVSILTNKDIFVPALRTFKTAKSAEFDPTGYKVVDKHAGEIGIVAELMNNEPQPLLLIKNGAKEILIPFVNEFIVKTDRAGKTIFTKIPEGLIELNN